MALSLDDRKLEKLPPLTKVSRSTSAPPPALKVQPRVPTALQTIFLESSRHGTADIPPPNGLANKTFRLRRWFSAGIRKRAGEDEQLDSSLQQLSPIQKIRRRLMFGRDQTIPFEKSRPTNCRRPVAERSCRWTSHEPKHDMPNRPQRHDTPSCPQRQ